MFCRFLNTIWNKFTVNINEIRIMTRIWEIWVTKYSDVVGRYCLGVGIFDFGWILHTDLPSFCRLFCWGNISWLFCKALIAQNALENLILFFHTIPIYIPVYISVFITQTRKYVFFMYFSIWYSRQLNQILSLLSCLWRSNICLW